MKGRFRVIARLAFRQCMRDTTRSALIVALIAAPIALAISGGIVFRSVTPTSEQVASWDLGSADLAVSVPAGTGGEWKRLLPRGSRAVDFREWQSSLVVDGALRQVTISDAPVADDLFRGKVSIRHGRAPYATDEVAVSPSVAKAIGRGVGERVRLDDMWGERVITGIVVMERAVSADLVVLGGDTPRDRSAERTWFVDVQTGASRVAGMIRAMDSGVVVIERATPVVREDDGRQAVLLASGLLAILSALVTSSALASGARGRLRELGLVGAVGADRRTRTLVVLAGGLFLGVAAAAVGGVLGAVTGAAALAFPGRLVDHATHGIVWSWADVALALAIGAGTALVAAILPARWTASMSITESLGDRVRPMHRDEEGLNRLGLLAVLCGVGLVVAGGVAPGVAVLLVMVGATTIVTGFAVACPGLLRSVSSPASVLPVSVRIALRDLGRHPREAGFGIAAIMTVLAAVIAVSTVLAAVDAETRRSYIPFYLNSQVLVPQSPEGTSLGRAAALRIAEAHPGAIVTELVYAAATDGSELRLGATDDEGMSHVDSLVAVGGEELIDALGGRGARFTARPPESEPGELVVYGGDSSHTTLWLATPSGGGASFRAVTVDADIPALRGLPVAVIAPEDAARLGLGVLRGWLVKTPRPLTDEQIAEAESIARIGGGVGVEVETGPSDSMRTLRWAALAAGNLTALGLLAVSLALAMREVDATIGTMRAVGMTPMTGRLVMAVRAALITMAAGIVAVPAGMVPGFAIVSARAYPCVVPWATLLAVIIVLPVVAGLVAALTPSLSSPRRGPA